MKRKWISLVLSAVTMMSLFTACGEEQKPTGGASASNTPAQKTGESGTSTQMARESEKKQSEADSSEMVIEFACPPNMTLPEEGKNFCEEELAKAIGVKAVKMTVLGAGTDYATALNTRISGGDIPDFFDIPNLEVLSQYVSNGVVLPLDEYMDKFQAAIDYAGGKDKLALNYYNGSMYTMPLNSSAKSYSNWLIRQDWLDTLKIKSPTTVDELIQVAKKFIEDDPDGNGQKDTFGITGGLAVYENVMLPEGAAFRNHVVIRNGEAISSLFDVQAMKNGLANAKKLYDSGVVDPDVLTNTDQTIKAKLIQGKAGIGAYHWAGLIRQSHLEQIKEVNPKAEWTFFKDLKGNATVTTGMINDMSGSRGKWVLSNKLKDDENKLIKVFDLFNYVASDEGNRLVCYGIEGRHYNVENGQVVKTDLMGKECDYLCMYQLCSRDDQKYLSVKFPEAKAEIEECFTRDSFEVYDAAVTVPEEFYKSDMDRYVEENMIMFIYGERSIDEYETFLQELEDKFKLKSVFISSANKQMKEKGYIK